MKASILFVAIATFLVCAGPVHADPITTFIVATLGVSSTVAGIILNIGLSIGLSALGAALAKKPDGQRQAGIKTDATTTGGDAPETFILGRYATAGHMMAPPYSHPNSGGLPNEYLTYVIDIAGISGVTFERIMVSGEYVTDLQASSGDHDQEGMIEGSTPHFFLTWHDGSQTTADAYMMANYADYPERPWASDMVGEGLTYAVVTFRYDRELFNQLPGVRFEVMGIPLYDPRLDTTVGGSGAHRWDDPDTWEQTENPIVMVYNILRGITLAGGRVWGGQVSEDDLPLANWFAAMNECDVDIDLDAGGTEPQYRAGYEVSVDETPASVIEELLKACSAEISEFGGVYKVRVGPPAIPVFYFTDDDIVSDVPQSLQPYPGLDSVHNAIHASHPAPDALWETRDAPPLYNPTWEAEDGDRQLVADVDLPAVTSDTQVQRLMKAWIQDARRFRSHGLTLPPEAIILEPLDTVGWTSARNGYTAKVFECGEVTDDLVTLLQNVSLRERDQDDFVWVPGDDEIDVTHPSTTYVTPVSRTVPGWTVTPIAILDESGDGRRPALKLEWDDDKVRDTAALEYEVRSLGQTELIAKGTVTDVTSGQTIVSDGILPGQQVQARARLLLRRAREWTSWTTVTTLDLKITSSDLDDTVNTLIQDAIDAANEAQEDADAALTELDALNDQLVADLDELEARVIRGEFGVKGNFEDQDLGRWENVAAQISATPGSHPTGRSYSMESTDEYTFYRAPGGGSYFPKNLRGYRIRVRGWSYKSHTGNPVTAHVRLRDGTGALTYHSVEIRASASVGWIYFDKYIDLPDDKDYEAYSFYYRDQSVTGGVFYTDIEWLNFSPEAWAENAQSGAEAYVDANTYTQAETDSAIAASETTLQASIDGVTATLESDYYTSAETDSALTAYETSLLSTIDNQASLSLPSTFEDDDKFWTSVLSGAPGSTELDGDVWDFNNSTNHGRVARINDLTSPVTENITTRGVFRPKHGRTYRLRVMVNLTGTTGGGAVMNLAFTSLDASYTFIANNGNVAKSLTPGAGWVEYQIELECGDANISTYWRPRLNLNGLTSTDGTFRVEYILVEDVTTSLEDIGTITATLTTSYYTSAETDAAIAAQITILGSTVGTNSGDISDILALDVDLESAFGTLMTQLDVDVDGTSATVLAQGNALATIDEKASASYVLRTAVNGSEAAEIEMVAWDDADDGDAGSAIKITAKYLFIDSAVRMRQLQIGDFTNLFAGGDFEDDDDLDFDLDDDCYTDDSRAYEGTRSLRFDAGAANRNFTTSIEVQPGEVIEVSFFASRTVDFDGGTGCRLRFRNLADNSFIAAVTFQAADMASAGSSNWYEMTGTVTVPAGCTRMGMQLWTDHTAGSVWLDKAEGRRTTPGRLIVGEIFSDDFSTGVSGWSIDKSGAAEFNQLIVRQSIVEGAVTDRAAGSNVTSREVGSDDSAELVAIDIGAVDYDKWHQVMFVTEHRGQASPACSTQITAQVRTTPVGGSPGSWTNIPLSQSAVATGDTWVTYNFLLDDFCGRYDKAEFRMVVTSSAPAATWTQNNIRRSYVTATSNALK